MMRCENSKLYPSRRRRKNTVTHLVRNLPIRPRLGHDFELGVVRVIIVDHWLEADFLACLLCLEQHRLVLFGLRRVDSPFRTASLLETLENLGFDVVEIVLVLRVWPMLKVDNIAYFGSGAVGKTIDLLRDRLPACE